MRKSLVVLMAALVATATLSGAASAQGFRSLYSRNGSDVWAVGDAGVTYRSFDSGATWFSQTIGTKPFHGVAHQGLVVMFVSDDGEVRRSTDNGGTFALQSIGASHLRAIEMVDTSTGWIVGDGGVIYGTTDGGASWTPQTSGSVQHLNAVRFRDANEGWAVGAGGTVLHTVDGGANWGPVGVGTTRTLRGVDYLGTTVWVVGDFATAIASPDGSIWTPLDLKLDAKSNVTGVWIESLGNIVLTGGGGFVRKTTDGGATWSFQKNTVLAESSDIFFTNGGTKGWVAHRTNRAVSRTADSGATWTYTGSVTRSFSNKRSVPAGMTVRGNSLCVSGVDNNRIFVALGTSVYRSNDRGETWSLVATITGGGSKTNAFYVHPNDDSKMIAAIGSPDRIMRSINGGANWTQTLTVDFTEYGVPLEMNGDNGDNLIFGPEDGKLYSTSDFGATWTTISTPGFRSPCDIQIVQDNNNVIWVGDGITGSGQGQMFRSTNGGASFSLIYTTSGSEIPMISGTHLNPNWGFSTHWSSGGCQRTSNMGASWSQVATTGSAWGCDYSDDDPNVMAYGVYSGGINYLSLDAGASGSFLTTSVSGSNYSVYMPDRATIFSLQSGGVNKMAFAYTANATATQGPITVSSPNGGEVWAGGEARNITWSSSNLGLAKIEFRTGAAEPWQLIALADGQAGSVVWNIPGGLQTTTAEVRVSDGWDANPSDVSNATFTVQGPVLSAAPTLDFGPHAVGTQNALAVTVQNTGAAAFTGTAAVTGDGFRLADAAELSIPASSSVDVFIEFSPGAVQIYSGSLDITGNAAPTSTALAGEGTQAAALQLEQPNGGESWQYNSSQSIQWSSAVVGQVKIEYQISPQSGWTLIADNVPATPNSYAWTIPNTPSQTARVRVVETGGALVDESDAEFALTAPYFSASTSMIDFGVVNVGSNAQQTLTISNPGTAPLEITAISSDNPEVAPVVTTLSIPPAGTVGLDVLYAPTAPGADAATLTFVDDAPGSPHTVGAQGEGQTPSDAGTLPTTFAMLQDGPNPFHGVTTIRYRLPQSTRVALEVFDLQGHRVATLVRGEQAPGEYAVDFGSGRVTGAGDRIGDLAAGVYFVRLQAGSYNKTAKMVLAR